MKHQKEHLYKLMLNNHLRCPICKTPYRETFLGINKCSKCGYEEQNDFGKVRTFLEENGPQPSTVIAEATHVPIRKIDHFLMQGRLEIPEGSTVFIQCQSCGVDLRYGRFCPECALKLCKKLQSAFNESEVGEQPKKRMSGKMQFIGRNRLD